MPSSSSKTSAGFTLVEIAIAVAILGLGLATLIALESRYVNNNIRERNMLQAALMGQYIMTMLEVDRKLPDEGTKEGDLADILQDYGYFSNDERMASAREKELRGWRYLTAVTKIDLPLMEDVMRKVELSIFWGPSESETFNLTYFIRTAGAGRTTSR